MRKGMKYGLIATLALILFGAGCAPKAANNNTNTNKPDLNGTYVQPASGTFTVSIKSDNTFDPTTVFVRPGTVVTWKNDDAKNHGILVNEHVDLPELDAKSPIPPGGSWSFTFTKVGRWNYHDPLNPAFGGAVVVEQ